MNSIRFPIFVFLIFFVMNSALELRANDQGIEKLNRQLDQKIRGLKQVALRKIEKHIGLSPKNPKKILLEFQDLPKKEAEERRINGSHLIDMGEGHFKVVLYREFARAHLIHLQGEATYQIARAVWRQNYPHRARVAAWFLHGIALHASGLGDARILFLIADNERKTVSIVDGWEDDRKHNERDHADDILFFRFAKKDLGREGLKKFIQDVAGGTEPHRAIGDRYPGGFKNLEIEWKKKAKKTIDEMTSRGLDEFRQVYATYQESKDSERAKMTGAFIKLLSRYRNAFWEGKARYYLGQCWLKGDREDKALTQFKLVLEDLAHQTDPRFLDMAKYRLSEMYLERGKVSSAINNYKEYLRDFVFGKYTSKVHYALAEIYADKRQNKKAEKHLEWVMSNDADSSTGKKAKKLFKKIQ